MRYPYPSPGAAGFTLRWHYFVVLFAKGYFVFAAGSWGSSATGTPARHQVKQKKSGLAKYKNRIE